MRKNTGFWAIAVAITLLLTPQTLSAQSEEREDKFIQALKDSSLTPIDMNKCERLLRNTFQEASRGGDLRLSNTFLRIVGCLDVHSWIKPAHDTKVREFTAHYLQDKVRSCGTVKSWKENYVLFLQISVISACTPIEMSLALASGPFTNLVIDLRHNPGGIVSAVHEMLKLFAPHHTRRAFAFLNSSGFEFFDTNRVGDYSHTPTLILVDRTTASAAEIFAGVMRSWYGTSVRLVGQTTYGKGIAQNVIVNDDAVEAGVTGHQVMLWSPKGFESYNEVGLLPDIMVRSEKGRDPAMVLARKYYGLPVLPIQAMR